MIASLYTDRDILREREKQFPLGASIRIEELEDDPYAIYKTLRENEPITWISALNMWFITSYDDVSKILLDSETFTTTSDRSTLVDTFGLHMLTVDGKLHKKYKTQHRHAFKSNFILENVEDKIRLRSRTLIHEFQSTKSIDLRKAYASRLPILTMLHLFSLPLDFEPQFRAWYDSFANALSNFTGDRLIQEQAHKNVQKFYQIIDDNISRIRETPNEELLSTLVHNESGDRLTDDEIKKNASIIFFGGISTVEALILNTLWALNANLEIYKSVLNDLTLLPAVIEETVRFLSPVQAAHRYPTRQVRLHGITIEKDDVIACMLGAANHDPAVFPKPDSFDIQRPNIKNHIGFATGPHFCLGLNLARAEAIIALTQLFKELGMIQINYAESILPKGYEFRQSPKLIVEWE